MGRQHLTEDELRQQIVEIGRRMYAAGHVAGGDGNISVRLGSGQLLATPAGAHKGRLQPGDLVKTDLLGRPLGRGKPSSELRLHLLVYSLRPDVRAVVHGHPPHAVALSLAGFSLAGCLLPETVLALGSVPTAPYATPTTEEVPESVRDLLHSANAVILARHGSLTLGDDLEQAFHRLEALEHSARITVLARSMGPVEPLAADKLARLEALASQLGVPLMPGTCSSCGTCSSTRPEADAAASSAAPASADHQPPNSPTLSDGHSEALIEDLVERVMLRLLAQS